MRFAWPFLFRFAAAAHAAETEIHYAPVDNLEAIDVELIDNAGISIDMAAYVLTDAAVIEALGLAADRGVAVRLYLDRGEFESHARVIADLIAKPGVTARVKTDGVLMHMKAYAVDRARLRTGSGNFSASGLARRDNDLLTTDDAGAVAKFETEFERVFASGTAPNGAVRF